MHSTPPVGRDASTGFATVPATWRRPVFVGGTGRSGTWALGRLFSAPPAWKTVATELRFHAVKGGMAHLLRGELPVERFVRNLRQHWYRQTGASGRAKGLQVVVDEDPYEAAVDAFAADLDAGLPVEAACQSLFLRVLHPYLRRQEVTHWAETTPDNAAAAAELVRVFPRGRFVHAIRDGRDAAASVISMPWGPDTPDEALAWWERRVRAADRGLAACPPGQRHVVRLEQLVATDRDATFATLLDFLAPDDEERRVLRRYFDEHLTADRANVGRWRQQLDRRDARRFDRTYRRIVRRLAADGLASVPLDPDAVDELAGR